MYVLTKHSRASMALRTACAMLLSVSLAALPFAGADSAQARSQAHFASVASIDGEAQTLYTSQNGLPATAVTAIAQTSDGFIWIGGYEGLVSSDGQVFDTQEASRSFNIATLLPEDDGSLWVGTSNKGLFRYENGEYTQIECSDNDKSFNEVLCMAKAADGAIVLGTEHGIARVSAGEKASELSVKALSNTLIRDIAASDGESILVVTQDSRLFHIAGNEANEVSLSGVTGAPRCVSYDSATRKFHVGTDKNAVCTLSEDGVQESLVKIEGANCINCVNASENDVTWICSDNGIYSYRDGKTVKQNLQMDNSVDSMLIDSEGNHWFASSRQGALLVGNTPFEDVSSYLNMPQTVVNALVKFEGKLLVGTDSGTFVIDPASDSVVSDSRFKILDKLRVRDIKTDKNGRLWVATTKGGILCMSKGGNWTSYTAENTKAITTNNFRCLYEMGSSMVAGSDDGAVIIDKSGVRNVVDDPSTLAARVMSISKIGKTMFFGTDNFGLQLVEDGKVVGSFTTETGLPSNSIMKICPCSNNKDCILVTGSGLAKLASAQEQLPEHYTEGSLTASHIEGFPATNTLDLIWQDSDTVWVAAGSGIFRTTESSLLNDESVSAKLYSRRDGLPYDITANSTQLVDGNVLYLSGTGGIAALNMKSAAATTDSCTLSISGAYTDGQLISPEPDGSLTIPADTERVKILAHATTYDKTNITLFYKLDGYDSREATTPLSSFDGVEYTNIKGGSYQLQFGVWDEARQAPSDTIAVTIKKEYGLVDHPATRIVAAAFVLALIALGFAWRRRRLSARLQKEYEEKEHRALEKMAYSDFLTEAYNRNYLNVWSQTAREGSVQFPLCLVSIDLNNLKLINDTAGHGAGDRYLQSTIEAVFTAFDEESTTVVRLGGDEFLIIAEGIDEAQAAELTERTREILALKGTDEVSYDFCYGIVSIEDREFSLDEKLRLADEQLVENKRRYHETHDRRMA